MANPNGLNKTSRKHLPNEKMGTVSNLPDGLKSLKRMRTKSLSEEMAETKEITKSSNHEQSTQTQQTWDEMKESLKAEIFQTIKSKFEKHLECSVCKEICLETSIPQCGHIFCSYCIRMCLFHAETCPLCRMRIDFVVGSKPMDNFIQDMFNTYDKTSVSTREALVNDRRMMLENSQSSYENINEYNAETDVWEDLFNIEDNPFEFVHHDNFVETEATTSSVVIDADDNNEYTVQHFDTTEIVDLTGSDDQTNETLQPRESNSATPSVVIDADDNNEYTVQHFDSTEIIDLTGSDDQTDETLQPRESNSATPSVVIDADDNNEDPVEYLDSTETVNLSGSDGQTNENMQLWELNELFSFNMPDVLPTASDDFSIPDSATPSVVIDIDDYNEDPEMNK